MKINDIMLFNLKEAKDPDAEKIIVAHQKRIDILNRARGEALKQAKQFEYIRNNVLELAENIREIAQKTNVNIEEYQISDVREAIDELAKHVYDLTTTFTDEIEKLEFKIEQFDWPEDTQTPNFDFRNFKPPEQ